MATIADDRALLNRAAGALIDYYDHPVAPWQDADAPDIKMIKTVERHAQQQLARDLVNQALRQGLSMRQIASHSQLPGKLIIPLIQNDQDRANAFAAEIHHLERAIEEIRTMQQREARERYRGGEKKTDLAASFGITRPTLDKWLEQQ